MFDFRYHAVSLAAVFIALVVGVLLGVAIGDAGLVSSAEHKLVDSLQAHVASERSGADQLRTQLDLRTQYEQAAFGGLVANRLHGRRIGVVFLGGASNQINDLVRAALDPSGARVAFVVAINEPPNLGSLGSAAAQTRFSALGSDPALLRSFAVLVGRQLVRARGTLLQREQNTMLGAYDGTLVPVDGVVLVRSDATLAPNDQALANTFDAGVAAGLASTQKPIVGVETTSQAPSTIPWFVQQNLSSVDDLDDIAGRSALVFALAGLRGTWGTKSTAQAILPTLGTTATTGQ